MAGRPQIAPEDRRTCNLQVRLTQDEMGALRRLHAAACLDRGRDVPLAEIAHELILSSERMRRVLAEMPLGGEEHNGMPW